MRDITVHFKGGGRREEEGGARRKGARRGSKMLPLRRKVRRKCDPLGRNKAESTSGEAGGGVKNATPLGRKCVKNATPCAEIRQKARRGVKNATPWAKSASKTRTFRQEVGPRGGFAGRSSFARPGTARGGHTRKRVGRTAHPPTRCARTQLFFFTHAERSRRIIN